MKEFETEHAAEPHLWKQSVTRRLNELDATDIEKPMWSNSLTPSDSMLQEFTMRYGNLASNAAELSES